MEQGVSKVHWLLGGGLLVGAIVMGLYGIVYDGNADDMTVNYGTPAEMVTLYQENCSDCHLAYPPSLLPQVSWQRMMAGLANHFGEDAELEQQTSLLLTDYLLANSLSSLWLFRHQGEGDVPMRITQLNYFVRQHDDIPSDLVEANEAVGSFGNCSACHQIEGRKMFDDDRVSIPGYGAWED